MKEALVVFLGGGIGSVLRYFFSKFLNNLALPIPLGTLFANFFACLIFGLLSGYLFSKIQLEPLAKLLILTGICGGLSTFSTFNYELFLMIKNGQIYWALVYLILSFAICLGSFFFLYKQ